MNFISIALKSLWYRRFAAGMTVLSLGLSVGLLVGVERLRHAGKDSFGGAISQTDLIVGPRTGSVSLLLYSVFHIGSPLNNIKLSTMQTIAADPRVDWVVPISLGDGFRGFPVVATTVDFFRYYKFGKANKIQWKGGETSLDKRSFVVIGSSVADQLNLKIADSIVLAHGHSEDGDGFETHADHPLKISGILQPTGSPVDRSVFVSLNTMDELHHDPHIAAGHDEPGIADEHHHEDADTGISAFFVGAKDRSAALVLMRQINEFEEEPVTAVMPAVALNDLWRALGVFESTLAAISFMVALIALCGMWVSLHILADSRQREMAILRSVGATGFKIIAFLTFEALVVSFLAVAVSFASMLAAGSVIRPIIATKYGIYIQLGALTTYEWCLVAFVILLGSIAGLIPAMTNYRLSARAGLSTRM
jgi:putative ABC transport system permease protein